LPVKRIIHVVEDDDHVRDAVSLLLEASGYNVLTYPSGVAFLKSVGSAIPGCILLDIHMPEMNGLEVQRQLRASGVLSPVIILTGQSDISLAVEAMKGGAFEFLEKPYPNEALLEAVREAFAKLEATNDDRATTADAKVRVTRLTGPETQVMRGLLAGLPNKLIAYELDINVRTAESYRAKVMEKLNARGLSAAVRVALAAGMEPLIPQTRAAPDGLLA
jgi:two-component system response regulator FixJ